MRKIPEASEGRPRICHRNHACDAGSALALSEKYVKMRIQTIEKGMKNMKRAFALILALALLCAMAFAETAEPEVVALDPAVEMYVHAVHGLRLRSEMDLENDENIIRVLALNEAVLVDAIVDGVWAHVTWELPEAEQTGEATTVEGYVWYEYLGEAPFVYIATQSGPRTIIVYDAYVLNEDGEIQLDEEGHPITADQEMNKEEYVQYRVSFIIEEEVERVAQEAESEFYVIYFEQNYGWDYDPETGSISATDEDGDTLYYNGSDYYLVVNGEIVVVDGYDYSNIFGIMSPEQVLDSYHNAFRDESYIMVFMPEVDPETGDMIPSEDEEAVPMTKDQYVAYFMETIMMETDMEGLTEALIEQAEAEFDAIYAAQQSGVESSTVDWSSGEPVVVEPEEKPADEPAPLSGDDASAMMSAQMAATLDPAPDGDAPAPSTDQPPMAAADPAPVIDGGTGGISGYVPNPSAE